jgi:hypothetical protein
MTSRNSGPRPAIDDGFWFDLSKTLIIDAAARQTEAAARVQNLVGWLWTVYTATVAAGSLFGNLSSSEMGTLVVPAILLIIAYASTVKAQIPLIVAFDPRSPDDIEEAYDITTRTRSRWLSMASVLAALATAVMIAVLVFLSRHSEKQSLLRVYGVVGGDPRRLLVEGTFDQVDAILVQINSSGIGSQAVVIKVPSSGKVFAAVMAVAKPESVDLLWRDHTGRSWTMSQRIDEVRR